MATKNIKPVKTIKVWTTPGLLSAIVPISVARQFGLQDGDVLDANESSELMRARLAFQRVAHLPALMSSN